MDKFSFYKFCFNNKYKDFIPDCIYRYIGPFVEGEHQFQDENNNNLYIHEEDLNLFRKSGMKEENWNSRNNRARTEFNYNNMEKHSVQMTYATPENKKPYYAYPDNYSSISVSSIDPTMTISKDTVMAADAVDSPVRPSHYKIYDSEVKDLMIKLFGIEEYKIFCKLNSFKYRMRAGKKGNPDIDISKAEFYENELNK